MALAPPANNAGLPIPAILADPPTLSDIVTTKDYVKWLIKSKATHSENHTTDDEIGAAELYHYECVLKTSLGGAAAPPWLEELINTLCQTRQIIERIEQSQKRTSAVIENMRIGKSNVELAKNTGSTSYRAKKKEVDGDGTILANNIIPNINHPLAPLAAEPALGTVFAPTIDTHNLSHQAILRIVQYYNQNFEIQPGDTRSQKIANWLTSEI